MWLIPFALSVAAAIVFSVAAIVLQQRSPIHHWISGGFHSGRDSPRTKQIIFGLSLFDFIGERQR